MTKAFLISVFAFLATFLALPLMAQHGHQEAAPTAPASVKAVFPEAQTFTKQHRDLSSADIAAIEKESGTPWTGDRDFHTYLAIGTKKGRRVQLGAATVMEDVRGAGDLTISFDNNLKITRVTASKRDNDATSTEFLSQFTGKGHDDSIKLGLDIKHSGSDRAAATAITDAVRQATHTMQRLYGAPHSH